MTHPRDKMIEYTISELNNTKGYVRLSRITFVDTHFTLAVIHLDTGETIDTHDSGEAIAQQMDAAFGWMTKAQFVQMWSDSTVGLNLDKGDDQTAPDDAPKGLAR